MNQKRVFMLVLISAFSLTFLPGPLQAGGAGDAVENAVESVVDKVTDFFSGADTTDSSSGSLSMVPADYADISANDSLLEEFRQRQETYQQNVGSSKIVSAYTGQPISESSIQGLVEGISENTLADFRLIEIIRILNYTNDYDHILLPAIQDLPYWLTKGDVTRNYWSENHMIMWMSTNWLLHEREGWPIDSTLRSRLLHWLKLKPEYGYYEFFSHTYAPFSLNALLNLYDFAEDEEIKTLAGEAALVLLKDLVLVTNANGLAFPVTGRAYSSKYTSENPAGHTHNKIIALLTGKGTVPTGSAGNLVDGLATTTLDVSSAIDSYQDDMNVSYYIGHSLNDTDSVHAGQTDFNKTIFQWSHGGYFHPDVSDDTYRMLTTYDLWDHPNFSGFSMLGKPAEATEGILDVATIVAQLGTEVLSDIAKGSVITGVTVDIFKNASTMLSSVQNFNPGRVGYQLWPWAATTGTIAVYSQSGDKSDKYIGNSHLPYVEQNGNLALVMYKPGAVLQLFGPLLGFKSFDVGMHWPTDRFDETLSYGNWIVGREGNSYVAIYRPCGTALACKDPLQTWAVLVGNANTHGDFENFKNVVAGAKMESQWFFDWSKGKNYFIGGVTMDGKTIRHAWSGHVEDVATLGLLDKNLLNSETKTWIRISGTGNTPPTMDLSLLGAHNKYFVSESNGGKTINANRTAIGSYEKFKMTALNSVADCISHGDQVSIQAGAGHYWSAQSNGGLDSDRTSLGSWEKFTLVNHSNSSGCLAKGHSISLKSVHNKYVVAESNGSANANRSAIGSWEKMTVK